MDSRERTAMCDLPVRTIWRLAQPWGPEFAASWAAWCAGLPVTGECRGRPARIRWTLRELEHLAFLAHLSRQGRLES